MSTTITVTVATNARQAEIPGAGVWGAGRFWSAGVEVVQVLDQDLTALEAALLFANEARTGLGNNWTPARLAALGDAVVTALSGSTGGIAPFDIAPSTAAPGAVEDTAFRTTLGQRAYTVLLRCPPPIVVEVLP